MKKVIVVSDEVNNLAELSLKEKYGKDVIIVTTKQAKEQGLTLEDFDNIPKIELTPAVKIVEYGPFKSGKEKRRERRAKNRNRI